MRHILVRDERQEVLDQVEVRRALVVGFDDVPRRLLDVAVSEHLVLRLGVVDPSCAGLQVHRAQFPTLARVVDPGQKPALLLSVAHREPVLDQDDP